MNKRHLLLASLWISCPVLAPAQDVNRMVIDADLGKDTISRHIYGHFSEHLGNCIYGGYWVGEDSPIPNTRGIRKDVVQALRDIAVPNLRWPGGCFADEYHWMDGIGPREKRPRMVNTHWGGVVEDNSFGTHEFLDLCEQLGCEPYICGNVGSGTVEEMSKWVEYMTFGGESPMANLRRQNGREHPWRVKFWGLGNESWGCGGNMTADFYTDQYRRYATYCRNFGENRLYKIACGPTDTDYNWMETLMKGAAAQMQGISLHYYTLPGDWTDKGSATLFGEAEYFTTIRKTLLMDEFLTKHTAIMDQHDPQRKVGLIVDEWGAWYNVEPGTNRGFLRQQSTLRDAIIAGINLNFFNNHCNRVKMTNLAQTINVLQAVILTEGEKMLLTPTYWVYRLYKVHHDAVLLPVSFTSEKYVLDGQSMDAVQASASRDAAGRVHITPVNIDPNREQTIEIELRGMTPKRVSGQVLTADKLNGHNTFDRPETVRLKDFDAVKLLKNGMLRLSLPPKSVVMLEIE
jgi:alpha-N-arabinofuranosidase